MKERNISSVYVNTCSYFLTSDMLCMYDVFPCILDTGDLILVLFEGIV